MTPASPDDRTSREQIREELDSPAFLQRLLDEAAREIEDERTSLGKSGISRRDWAVVVALAVIIPAILFFAMVSNQTYAIP